MRDFTYYYNAFKDYFISKILTRIYDAFILEVLHDGFDIFKRTVFIYSPPLVNFYDKKNHYMITFNGYIECPLIICLDDKIMTNNENLTLFSSDILINHLEYISMEIKIEVKNFAVFLLKYFLACLFIQFSYFDMCGIFPHELKLLTDDGEKEATFTIEDFNEVMYRHHLTVERKMRDKLLNIINLDNYVKVNNFNYLMESLNLVKMFKNSKTHEYLDD